MFLGAVAVVHVPVDDSATRFGAVDLLGVPFRCN